MNDGTTVAGRTAESPGSQSDPGAPTLGDLGYLVLKLIGAHLLAGLSLGLVLEMLKFNFQVAIGPDWLKTGALLVSPVAILWVLLANKPMTLNKPLWNRHEMRDRRAWFIVLGMMGYSALSLTTIAFLASRGFIQSSSRGYVVPNVVVMILTTCATCILVPVAEEWLFRGFTQKILTQRWGAITGILLTALVFAVLHKWTWYSFLTVFGFALMTGWLAHRRPSLTVCILCHAGHNLVASLPGILVALHWVHIAPR